MKQMLRQIWRIRGATSTSHTIFSCTMFPSHWKRLGYRMLGSKRFDEVCIRACSIQTIHTVCHIYDTTVEIHATVERNCSDYIVIFCPVLSASLQGHWEHVAWSRVPGRVETTSAEHWPRGASVKPTLWQDGVCMFLSSISNVNPRSR